MTQFGLWRACVAEAFGTFLLVFFGTGVMFVAVLTDAIGGLFQVAVVWGIVIALAIYATSAVSGTHINPAVTLAFAVRRHFPWSRVGPYIASQVLGAFCAAALLYALFGNILKAHETEHGLVRGEPGSQAVAMVFGEYFPNPGMFGTDAAAFAKVRHWQAMLAEGVGTALLVLFVFALIDARNRNRPDGTLFAVFIGLTVTIIIMVVSPLTQAGLNPARDFGPRLFALVAGWGTIAIPGPRGGFFTVYILAPLLGGLVGGTFYDWFIRLPAEKVARRNSGVRHAQMAATDIIDTRAADSAPTSKPDTVATNAASRVEQTATK